jgi:hypothetical protein
MGNYISSALVPHPPTIHDEQHSEEVISEDFFDPSSLLYFGPNIVVEPSSTGALEPKNSNFLSPDHALWYILFNFIPS